jgi:hypothetical protein
MTDRELIEKAWGYLASYTVGERPNASEVNDLGFILERRLAQPERPWVGLTEDEVKHMLELFVIPPQHIEMVVQAIETKLKEKNA